MYSFISPRIVQRAAAERESVLTAALEDTRAELGAAVQEQQRLAAQLVRYSRSSLSRTRFQKRN